VDFFIAYHPSSFPATDLPPVGRCAKQCLQDLPHFRVDRLSPCSYGCGAHPSRSFYQELIHNYLTIPLKVF
jgi:hypothetical protein